MRFCVVLERVGRREEGRRHARTSFPRLAPPENNRGGPGGREPPRDEPRGPKRKKEKPREVKIL